MRTSLVVPRIARMILAISALMVPVAKGDALAGGDLVLVKDGQPASTIVTAAQPSENARVGAAELAKYVEKITGAKLPIATDTAPLTGTLILVGRRQPDRQDRRPGYPFG